jgi:hypothetical protein
MLRGNTSAVGAPQTWLGFSKEGIEVMDRGRHRRLYLSSTHERRGTATTVLGSAGDRNRPSTRPCSLTIVGTGHRRAGEQRIGPAVPSTEMPTSDGSADVDAGLQVQLNQWSGHNPISSLNAETIALTVPSSATCTISTGGSGVVEAHDTNSASPPRCAGSISPQR